MTIGRIQSKISQNRSKLVENDLIGIRWNSDGKIHCRILNQTARFDDRNCLSLVQMLTQHKHTYHIFPKLIYLDETKEEITLFLNKVFNPNITRYLISSFSMGLVNLCQ